MNNIGKFFDENSNFYDSKVLDVDDNFYMNFIKNQPQDHVTLLDVGGGNGNFSKLIKKNIPNINITILDPSKKLLGELTDSEISKVIGTVPDVKINSKFDYIHVKNVLHHITGKNIKESSVLLKKSLKFMNDHLYENGFLLVQELFYEGYLFPKLPNNLLFYLLSVQNKLNVKIPVNEFILGLNVNFYTREELNTALNESGFEIVESYEENFSNTTKKKLCLIKNWGRIVIIANKL